MSDLKLHHPIRRTDPHLRFDIAEVATVTTATTRTHLTFFSPARSPSQRRQHTGKHRSYFSTRLIGRSNDVRRRGRSGGRRVQRTSRFSPTPNAFRRLSPTVRCIVDVKGYFARQENSDIRAVGDVRAIRTQRRPSRNTVEEEMIATETPGAGNQFPALVPSGSGDASNACVSRPDFALKSIVQGGRGPDKWAHQRRRRPILNLRRLPKLWDSRVEMYIAISARLGRPAQNVQC